MYCEGDREGDRAGRLLCLMKTEGFNFTHRLDPFLQNPFLLPFILPSRLFNLSPFISKINSKDLHPDRLANTGIPRSLLLQQHPLDQPKHPISTTRYSSCSTHSPLSSPSPLRSTPSSQVYTSPAPSGRPPPLVDRFSTFNGVSVHSALTCNNSARPEAH